MDQLQAQARSAIKAKKLRKAGIIPANIFGKNLDNSVSIELKESDITTLLRKNTVGSQVEVVVGSETYSTMLKEVKYLYLGKQLEHIEFQVLTTGEKAKVSVTINLTNRNDVPQDAIVQEMIHEIEYESLPVDMVDHIDVSLSGLVIGDSVLVSSLPIASDDRYNIITASDAAIVLITAAKQEAETVEDEEEVVEA